MMMKVKPHIQTHTVILRLTKAEREIVETYWKYNMLFSIHYDYFSMRPSEKWDLTFKGKDMYYTINNISFREIY
jgi:hypothetical protein